MLYFATVRDMDIHDIRLNKLRQLAQECGGRPELAEKMGISYVQLSNYIGKTPTRNIGNLMARRAESAFNKPHGWLDIIEEDDNSSLKIISLSSLGANKIPLLCFSDNSWSDYMHNINDYKPNKAILVSDSLGPRAFAMTIEDHSMSPEINPGDVVVINPDVEPKPGDIVMCYAVKEELYPIPRRYKLRGQGVFELVPLSNDFSILRSDLDEVKIEGVVVECRKYLRK
jgi:SOS-response transcriptional repressor LexA